MIYWPTTLIAKDPELHHTQVWELMCAERVQMSESTLMMAARIVDRTKACLSPMMLIYSDGGPVRRIYLKHPSPEDFAALERGGFVASQQSFGYICDVLH